jgi:hypothetical protein
VGYIPIISIIVSYEQQIKFMMLNITTIGYKLKQEFEPSRRRKQSKNDQGTYQVLMSTQLRQITYQTHGVSIKVTLPILTPQMIYTTLIMTT